MRIIIIQILLFTLLFLIRIDLLAQQNPHLINYSRAQYSANSKNWAISGDEKGIMYFANNGGLLEFDGIEWTLHEMTHNLPVISVAVESHEIVFTGSHEEFGRWDRDTSGKLIYTSLSSLIEKKLLRNDVFWKTHITPEKVYFQSFNSIYVYDYNTVKRIDSKLVFLFLSQVADEFLVQQMRGGIFRLTNDKLSYIRGSEIFQETDVRIILPFGSSKYLIGTSNRGIYLYDGNQFSVWNEKLSEKLSIQDLNCAIRTSRDTYIWGTILNGIYETDKFGNILNHISSKNSLQNNTVLGLYEDHAKNIWVGLDKGITQIRYIDNMSCYIDNTGNIGSVYGAIIWNDKLFLATNQGVFYDNMQEITQTNNLSNMKLVSGTQGQSWALRVIDNRLIVCNNKGLIEISTSIKAQDIYSLRTGVFQLKRINYKQKDFLFASTYSGLKIINNETGATYSLYEIDEPLKDVEIDHLNNIWLEHTFKGVYKCKLRDDISDYKNIKFYGRAIDNELPYQLKIFKVGGRIILYGENKFYIYDDVKDQIVINHELTECFSQMRNVKRIIHINDEFYWALANGSIHRFKYDGSKVNIIESYDLNANNLSMISEDPNIVILNDSINLICLDNGFLIYTKPTDSLSSTHQILPTPYFEYFKISNIDNTGRFLQFSKPVQIPYQFNTITVKYGANDILTKKLSFQYQLIGVDKEWLTVQQTNLISYARLNRGKYTLQIRTTDYFGNFSEIQSFEFEVLAPWYQSTWAYFIYFILIIAIIYFIWFMIRRYYKKQSRRKMRKWEAELLKLQNEELQDEIEKKNAELFTQTSFILKKNESMLKLKEIVDSFYEKNQSKSIMPLYHNINAYLNSNLNTDEDWEMFLIKFEEKHTSFFRRMKTTYPELNKYDLRLCACLKLNLDTKR